MTETVRCHMEERIALAEERTRREAAEEANRRLSFLAYAKAAVGQSLDPQVTINEILRVSVPRLAGRALLALWDNQHDHWQVLEAHPQEGELAIAERTGLEGLSPAWRQTVEQVMHDEDASAHAPRMPPGEPWTVMLPLRARQRTFGVLVLSEPATQQPWSGPDLTMVEALASRCGIG
jgi:hypothetical protein